MKKKVVLIQDNEDILHIMDHVLEEEGFNVTASLTTDPIDNRLHNRKPPGLMST